MSERDKLYARSAILLAASKTLASLPPARGASYADWGAVQDQARACRREAGVLLRRARKLDDRAPVGHTPSSLTTPAAEPCAAPDVRTGQPVPAAGGSQGVSGATTPGRRRRSR